MALVNHAKKEINAKIVYYGTAGCGKNTALTYIYSRIKPSLRGDLRNSPAGEDNLLFFDFSPFETPLPNGYRVRLHVYTLTGKVTNPATWKMTLKGADGIMIMVNPAAELEAETGEGVSQLRDFLSAYGVGLHETPAVLQVNSFTIGNMPDEGAGIATALDLTNLTTCHSNSACGDGLLEALAKLSRLVLDRITVERDHCQADSVPDNHRLETETAEMVCDEFSADSNDMSHPEEVPRVDLISREVVSVGRTIRIPLEITQGGTLRRLVVSVCVELEQPAELAPAD